MTHRFSNRLGILIFSASALLAGCEAKPGERCDGFLSNGCAYPGMCITTDDAKVCGISCEHRTEDGKVENYCKDSSHELVEVTADLGSTSASMGCYCVPKGS